MSISGVKKLWIEEGQYVSSASLEVLTPSVRSTAAENLAGKEPPEIWITMNRGSRQAAIAKRYLAIAEPSLSRIGRYEDELMMVVEINYQDNPWFPPEMEIERVRDKEQMTDAKYRAIWGGEYDETVEYAIIQREWFDAAIDSHLKLGITPKGATVFTYDPADMGKNSKAYACRTGIFYHDIGEIDAGDIYEGCDAATSMAIHHRADMFVWDGDGMGAGIRKQVAENFNGIKCELRMFRGSNEVENKANVYDGVGSFGSKDKPKTNADMFYNKRVQFYMSLANRFYQTHRAVVSGHYIDPDTIISISSDIKLLNKIRSEVCRLPTTPNGAGKIQLMSKAQMFIKHGIESPGMADCLSMGEELPAPVKVRRKIKYKGWR